MSLSLSVCPLVTSVYCEKTADSIEMPFGVVGWVDQRNHVLGGGPGISKVRGKFMGNIGRHNVMYREIAALAVRKHFFGTLLGPLHGAIAVPSVTRCRCRRRRRRGHRCTGGVRRDSSDTW